MALSLNLQYSNKSNAFSTAEDQVYDSPEQLHSITTNLVIWGDHIDGIFTDL
jgi:hypothetical protein